MRANTDDWCTWSTGNLGNRVLLHLAFVAETCWSRQEWLAQPALLAAGADVAAHWCGRYGIPARQATVAKLPGITTHDATRAWGGTDHTDPGEGFPWTEFLAEVRAARVSGWGSGCAGMSRVNGPIYRRFPAAAPVLRGLLPTAGR